jgi:hypothetical protein
MPDKMIAGIIPKNFSNLVWRNPLKKTSSNSVDISMQELILNRILVLGKIICRFIILPIEERTAIKTPTSTAFIHLFVVIPMVDKGRFCLIAVSHNGKKIHIPKINIP